MKLYLKLNNFDDVLIETYTIEWYNNLKSKFVTHPTYNSNTKQVTLNDIDVSLDQYLLGFHHDDSNNPIPEETESYILGTPIDANDSESTLYILPIYSDYIDQFQRLLENSIQKCISDRELTLLYHHLVDGFERVKQTISAQQFEIIKRIYNWVVKMVNNRLENFSHHNIFDLLSITEQIESAPIIQKLHLNINKSHLSRLIFLLEESGFLDTASRNLTVKFLKSFVTLKKGDLIVSADLEGSLERLNGNSSKVRKWAKEKIIDLSSDFPKLS